MEFVTIQAVEGALDKCKEMEIEGNKVEASLMTNLPGARGKKLPYSPLCWRPIQFAAIGLFLANIYGR